MSKNLELAENINTPAEELMELAANTNDKCVLAAIAKNPNTPIDLLIELAGGRYTFFGDYKLAERCIREIGNNPALELILLENPNLVADIYYKNFHHNSKQENNKLSCISIASWFFKLGVFQQLVF